VNESDATEDLQVELHELRDDHARLVLIAARDRPRAESAERRAARLDVLVGVIALCVVLGSLFTSPEAED
jgi:hypothetical protein